MTTIAKYPCRRCHKPNSSEYFATGNAAKFGHICSPCFLRLHSSVRWQYAKSTGVDNHVSYGIHTHTGAH